MKSGLMKKVAAAVFLAGGICAGSLAQADDFKWPKLFIVSSNGTETASFAQTSGWVPMMQEQTGMTIRVVPNTSDPNRYSVFFDRKGYDMMSISASEVPLQTMGVDAYSTMKPALQYLVWNQNEIPWAWIASKDFAMDSLDEVKDGTIRVADNLSSAAVQAAVRKGLPAYLGFDEAQTAEHIKLVPMTNYNATCRSVVEGTADIAWCSPVSSVTAELEASPTGIKWLGMPRDNKEGWKRFGTARPNLLPKVIDKGVASAIGVEGLTSNFIYTVRAETDEDLVYNIAKWMNEHYDEYAKTHGLASGMSLKVMRDYLNSTPLPVHPGTVRYLREIGQWTDADDTWNDTAKAQADAWSKARSEALAEAKSSGVKLNWEDPAFQEIYRKHTKDLDIFRARL